MAHRTTRLLSILQYLREGRRPTTARELAQRCQVSERTIHRDIGVLLELGVPVIGEAGLGFVLERGYFLPPLNLTEIEADALLLGLRFVSRRGDQSLADAAKATLAKIASNLDPDSERIMRANGLTVGPSESDLGRIGFVRQAMEAERKVRLCYVDKYGATSERTVWPVALGFFADAEVMVGWCETRESFRHFRLDRIRSFDLLSARMPTPRRILLAEYRLEEPDADL